MKWKAKYTTTLHTHGTSRLKRVFAWVPVYVDGNMVWLETFEILQVYNVTVHSVVMDPANNKEFTNFYSGNWVDVSKRLITK